MTPKSSSLTICKEKLSRTRMVVFSFVALFSLVLAACGGSSPSSQSSQNSGQPTTINILGSPNGSFTAENFNPLLIPNNGSLFGAQGMIYETLIFDNRYNGQITPWLASSYQLASDVKSATFTIRQGVQWTDGTPLTSDDVVFTLNLLKQYSALDFNGIWTFTQDVSAPDANTVKVTFKQPDSTALWYLSQQFIVPKHLWSSIPDPTKFTNDKPVGTGPYVVKSFSAQAYVLAKNPKYWQPGQPAIDQLRFIATNDNTAATLAISQGQIDWAGVGWDPKYDASFISKDPQHNHHWFTPNNAVMLYLNLTKFPFNDLNVRKAISLAINRQELHDKAALYAVPANPTAILPSSSDYLAPEYQSAQVTQDINQANQLMQQAGFTKGSDGIYAKNGQKVSFSMIVPNGWSDWQSTLALISNDLKQVGMNAQVSALASPDLYTASLRKGTYDAAISWTDKGPTPFFPLDDLLDSAKSWDNGKESLGTNWEHWKDAGTDKMLGQYLTSSDPAVQKQAIQGIEKIMVDQLPVIPLDYNVSWFEYTTNHAVGWPDENNAYDYGSPFDAPDNEYIVLHLKPAK